MLVLYFMFGAVLLIVLSMCKLGSTSNGVLIILPTCELRISGNGEITLTSHPDCCS